MRARYYNPHLMRFLNADPIGFAAGSNWYAYASNSPLMHTDSSGLWFLIDDLIFSAAGAAIGVVGQFIANTLTGSEHHWQDYLGSAIGGAVGGEMLLYTTNPVLVGAVGGAAGNLVTQVANHVSGRKPGFDIKEFSFNTVLGGVTGLMPGLPKIKGVNAGRGSNLQVFKQTVKKAQKEMINNIKTETAWKMATGAFYEHAMMQNAAFFLGSQIYNNLANSSNLGNVNSNPIIPTRESSNSYIEMFFGGGHFISSGYNGGNGGWNHAK
jgi:hypothetical protein